MGNHPHRNHYIHHIYRITGTGDTDASLGCGDEVIGGAAWFTSRRAAEKFVSECVRAWLDNPPCFFDEAERDEYMAQDFRADYDIERIPLVVALDDLDEDDAERLAEYLGSRYPAGRRVPSQIAAEYRQERSNDLARKSANLAGASSLTHTYALLSAHEASQTDADRYPSF